MEWRVTKCGSSFLAERGVGKQDGVQYPGFVPEFVVYESARFSTHRKAEGYVRRRSKELGMFS
jgi:hypothetical protein